MVCVFVCVYEFDPKATMKVHEIKSTTKENDAIKDTVNMRCLGFPVVTHSTA